MFFVSQWVPSPILSCLMHPTVEWPWRENELLAKWKPQIGLQGSCSVFQDRNTPLQGWEYQSFAMFVFSKWRNVATSILKVNSLSSSPPPHGCSHSCCFQFFFSFAIHIFTFCYSVVFSPLSRTVRWAGENVPGRPLSWQWETSGDCCHCRCYTTTGYGESADDQG